MSQNKKQVEKSELQIELENLTIDEVRGKYEQAFKTRQPSKILGIYQKVLAKMERKSERGSFRLASRFIDSLGIAPTDGENVAVTVARDGKEPVTVTVTYKAKKFAL